MNLLQAWICATPLPVIAHLVERWQIQQLVLIVYFSVVVTLRAALLGDTSLQELVASEDMIAHEAVDLWEEE